MENKTAVIVVLVIVAALIVTASGAYAMGWQATSQGTRPNTAYAEGMGPSMMGGFSGSTGYRGGMMGGYGMMGNGASSMQQMWQYMSHFWNSTSSP